MYRCDNIEYRKNIEKDAALERRFQPIQVDEPTVEDTIAILKGLRDRYEAHHRINISDEALEAAAKLSDRYVSDRFLPDKTIDLIDEASSKVRLKSHTTPNNLKEIEQEIEKVKMKKTQQFMLKNSRMLLIYVINKLNLKNNMKMPK